jgi:hypothetical protein
MSQDSNIDRVSDRIKKVSIVNEKNVTADQIIKEANEIWNKAKDIWNGVTPLKGKKNNNGKGNSAIKISADDHTKLDELLDQMRAEHKEFATSYPTVLRHMVQEQWYSSNAFKDYMALVEKKPWTNDNERMDSYTTYAVLLFQATNQNKHLNKTTLEAFRRDYRLRLQKEHDDFMRLHKQYVENEKKSKAEEDQMRRDEMLNALKRLAPSAGISTERLEQIVLLVQDGILSTEELTNMVYGIHGILVGENPDKIRESATTSKSVSVHTAGLNKDAAERLKQLATEVAIHDSEYIPVPFTSSDVEKPAIDKSNAELAAQPNVDTTPPTQ